MKDQIHLEGFSLQEARQKICEREERKLQVTLAELRRRFENGTDYFIVEGRDLKLIENSLSNYAELLGINVKLLEKLTPEPELRENLIKFLTSLKPDTAITLILNNEMKYVESITERSVISELEIFDHTWICLPKNLKVDLRLNGKFEIRYITDFAMTPPRKKDDILKAGVHVYADNRGIEVSQFVLNLVCTNGLIGESIRFRRRINTDSDSRNILQQIKEATESAYNCAKDHLIPAFIEMDDVPLNNPSQRAHRLVREHRLPSKIESELLDRIPSLKEDCSYYDLINLLTEFGRDNEDVRFEKLASKLIDEGSSHRCSHCQRRI